MNKNFPILSIVVAITLFFAAYGALVVEAQPAEAVANSAAYETVLGKSLDDQDVADFILSNDCASAGPFQMCNAAGLALWIGPSQNVETAVLYPNQIDDFAAYKGTLPFGLSANDTMANVERKLGHPQVNQGGLQAGWEPGVPDKAGTPDHIHYWAIYKRFGVTIVYNSPSGTDKGATIQAILVSK